MDRIAIKEKAKKMAKEKLKDFWKGYGIILIIEIIGSIIIDILFNKGSIIYNGLTILLSFFTMILSVGFYSYILKMIRKEEYKKEDMFQYVGNILPIVAISLLVGIFCMLWSILFIIPGIIAAISYSMVYFIYVDDSSLSPMEYLNKSKEMMNGYKWDYFIFTLSFFGWILLSILTVGILLVFTLPYITIAEGMYYDELKKLVEKNNVKL